jgi:hypothetical protein
LRDTNDGGDKQYKEHYNQYKQAIGNIPMQIKKLRADIDQAMNVTVDDDSEEEAI